MTSPLAIPGKAVALVHQELEYELHQAPPIKNKVTLVLLTGLAGICGCDRCYMGQVMLGVLKGVTFGGVGVWAFVDAIVIYINCGMKSPSIDSIGFKGVFEPESIVPAFWVM